MKKVIYLLLLLCSFSLGCMLARSHTDRRIQIGMSGIERRAAGLLLILMKICCSGRTTFAGRTPGENPAQ